jgi:hypothetical protein
MFNHPILVLTAQMGLKLPLKIFSPPVTGPISHDMDKNPNTTKQRRSKIIRQMMAFSTRNVSNFMR